MRQFAFASYLLYFLAGMVITTVGSVLPQLLAHYHLSYTVGGQLVFVGSAGFIIGVPLSTVLLSRLSEKNLLSIAAAIVSVAQLGILLLPSERWVFALNFIDGIGAATIETIVATLMMEVFVGRRAVAMSYLEVSFGLGALLMPIIASLLIAHDAWRFVFLVTGCLGAVLAIVWQMISFSKEDVDVGHTLDAQSPALPNINSKTAKSLMLFLFAFMIFMYTGVEGSLNNFLSSIFIKYLGEVPYYASLSIGIFWTAMVVGRIATGWIIRKVTYSRYLFWSIAGTLAVLVSFILLKNSLVGYALVMVLGLAMSGIYSITMVYANHTLPGLARLVTTLITGFAGLGGAVFPALIGFTMDNAGIGTALWLIVGLAGLYTAALLMIFGLHIKWRKNSVAVESA